jgi:hypothetical protein
MYTLKFISSTFFENNQTGDKNLICLIDNTAREKRCVNELHAQINDGIKNLT